MRLLFSFLLLLVLPAFSQAATAPIAIAPAEKKLRDADGNVFTLARPAQRIVSLAPSLTDMLVTLGARAQIVGASDDHDSRGAYQRSLSGFPVISDAASVNYERVLALRPDLVVAWGGGTPRPWIEQLRHMGLRVFVVEARTLDEIAVQAEQLGQLSGHEKSAQAEAASIRANIADLQKKYGSGPRLRYFHQVWLQPLYSLHAGHLLSQALALCGADNIVKAGPVAAPLINPEFVLQQNPDIILFSEGGADGSRAYWQRFPTLTAVRKQQLLAVNDRSLTRPGPAMLVAVAPVCARIATWRSGTAMESR
jgi:iron complex transport system substrate-binding protein